MSAKFVYNLVRAIEDLKSRDDFSGSDAIDAAIDAISQNFPEAVETNDNFSAYSYYPKTHQEIFEAGTQALKLETLNEALGNVNDSEKLNNFIALVRDKGYFDGAEEGSVEHLKRKAKLLQKFAGKNREAMVKEEIVKRADDLKNKGNNSIVAKKYQEAVEFYNQAIQLSADGPNSHIYYSNRAAAFSSMKQYEEAIVDCETAISLKNDFGKAYSRLGYCYFHLERYENAIDAYDRLLQIEPENQSAKEELNKCRFRLSGGSSSAVSSGGGGAREVPDLAALGSMLGGNPDDPMLASLMNNPMMKKALDAKGPDGLAAMMKDPNINAMAQKMMQNPDMLKNMMSMLGGAGAAAGGVKPSGNAVGKKPFKGFEEDD